MSARVAATQKHSREKADKNNAVNSQAVRGAEASTDLFVQRMMSNSPAARPPDILSLQQKYGNTAVQRLLVHERSSMHGDSGTIQRATGGRPAAAESDVDAHQAWFEQDQEYDKSYFESMRTGDAVSPEKEEDPVSFESLLVEARRARYTESNEEKLKFLKRFSEKYAPHLTGELEYFQFLAQKMAYMDLRVGDEIGANINTKDRTRPGSAVDELLGETEKQTDTKSDYSKNYKVARTYHSEAGLNCFLILPKDEEKSKNAIVLFRGTGTNTMGAKRGEASGRLTDTDYGGVGRIAFYKAEDTMKSWVAIAKEYARITISGHSLGGALAERFYALASKEAPGKLRLITYQGGAIDLGTTNSVTGAMDPQKKGAKVTRVGARGDAVQYGGMSHVPGEKLKYTSSASGLVDTHLQIDLVKQQLNRALNQGIERTVSNVVVHEKTGGTNLTKTLATTGKHLASLLVHLGGIVTVYHAVTAVKSTIVGGKEESEADTEG